MPIGRYHQVGVIRISACTYQQSEFSDVAASVAPQSCCTPQLNTKAGDRVASFSEGALYVDSCSSWCMTR